MTTIKFFKKAMVGTAAVATIFALAGCGKQSASSSDTSSSSTSSSVRSSESKASKAYRTANKLIQNHDYEGAYEQLNQLNDHLLMIYKATWMPKKHMKMAIMMVLRTN